MPILSFDAKGTNPANAFIHEEHQLISVADNGGINPTRVILLNHGNYRADSVEVYAIMPSGNNDTSTEMVSTKLRNFDDANPEWQPIQLDADSSARCGTAVFSGIYVTNLSAVDKVYVSYKAVGGAEGQSPYLFESLRDAIEANQTVEFSEIRVTEWPDYLEIPVHQHDIGEMVDPDAIIFNELRGLREALTGKRAPRNSGQSMVDRLDRFLWVISEMRNDMNSMFIDIDSVNDVNDRVTASDLYLGKSGEFIDGFTFNVNDPNTITEMLGDPAVGAYPQDVNDDRAFPVFTQLNNIWNRLGFNIFDGEPLDAPLDNSLMRMFNDVGDLTKLDYGYPGGTGRTTLMNQVEALFEQTGLTWNPYGRGQVQTNFGSKTLTEWIGLPNTDREISTLDAPMNINSSVNNASLHKVIGNYGYQNYNPDSTSDYINFTVYEHIEKLWENIGLSGPEHIAVEDINSRLEKVETDTSELGDLQVEDNLITVGQLLEIEDRLGAPSASPYISADANPYYQTGNDPHPLYEIIGNYTYQNRYTGTAYYNYTVFEHIAELWKNIGQTGPGPGIQTMADMRDLLGNSNIADLDQGYKSLNGSAFRNAVFWNDGTTGYGRVVATGLISDVLDTWMTGGHFYIESGELDEFSIPILVKVYDKASVNLLNVGFGNPSNGGGVLNGSDAGTGMWEVNSTDVDPGSDMAFNLKSMYGEFPNADPDFIESFNYPWIDVNVAPLSAGELHVVYTEEYKAIIDAREAIILQINKSNFGYPLTVRKDLRDSMLRLIEVLGADGASMTEAHVDTYVNVFESINPVGQFVEGGGIIESEWYNLENNTSLIDRVITFLNYYVTKDPDADLSVTAYVSEVANMFATAYTTCGDKTPLENIQDAYQNTTIIQTMYANLNSLENSYSFRRGAL